MSTEQRGISLSKKLWTWIYYEYPKHGYPCHSHFIRDELIMFAINNNPKLANPDPQAIEELNKHDQIREIADRRRADKFAIINATKDLKNDLEGLKEALDYGLLTQEEYDAKCRETEDDHKKVVKIQLSKKFEKPNSVTKPKEKTKKQRQSEMRERVRKAMMDKDSDCNNCIGDCLTCSRFDRERWAFDNWKPQFHERHRVRKRS